MNYSNNITDKDERRFYLVIDGISRSLLNDHLMHGYGDKWVFYEALRKIVMRWKGRVGERVDERHGFFLLRFHETPGGLPDEEWIPSYLLEPAAMPEYLKEPDGENEVTREIDRAFGFD